jgi:hypothetical protein
MVILHGAWVFTTNFFAHFAPAYLLVSGDTNLRHSTRAFGEWSWLDALALAGAALVMARARRRPTGWTLFVSLGYLAGIVRPR